MSVLATFAALETTVGVIGLMIVIVALVVVIGIFVAVQAAEEHLDNTQQRPDVRPHA